MWGRFQLSTLGFHWHEIILVLKYPCSAKEKSPEFGFEVGKRWTYESRGTKRYMCWGWGDKGVKLCRASTPKRLRLSIHHGWTRLSSLPTCLRPKIRVKRRLPSPFRCFSSRGRYLWWSHLLPAIWASRCVFGRWALRSKEIHPVTYRLWSASR